MEKLVTDLHGRSMEVKCLVTPTNQPGEYRAIILPLEGGGQILAIDTFQASLSGQDID